MKQCKTKTTSNALVPSGTINQETRPGTVTCLETVCFEGGKNLNPRYYARNADLNRKWTLKTQAAPPSPKIRPGLPLRGDPAMVEAVDRPEMVTTCAKTERGIDPKNFNNTEI